MLKSSPIGIYKSTIHFFLLCVTIISCSPQKSIVQSKTPYETELKNWWFDGKAEVSSYKLEQARYGEIRSGNAVLIYVTEDFSLNTLTKADQSAVDNIPVLKLNTMKSFITGIYPYTLMSSTFYPFPSGNQSVKVATSSQEWCGHTYMELTNRKGKQHIKNDSYFQKEAEKDIVLPNVALEDDLWTQLRINPDVFALGDTLLVPSFLYLRLSHQEVRGYKATLEKNNLEMDTVAFSITYPELQRNLTIFYSSNFPFSIYGWEESYPDGFGANRRIHTSRASLMTSLRTDYWTKNSVADSLWRQKLGL